MPTTEPARIITIADIVKTLTKCTKAEADAAEVEICKSPKGISILAGACTASIAAIGYGGVITVAGGPAAPLGLALGGAGVLGAKRYCNAMIAGVKNQLNSAKSQ